MFRATLRNREAFRINMAKVRKRQFRKKKYTWEPEKRHEKYVILGIIKEM